VSPCGGLTPYRLGEVKNLITSQFYSCLQNCFDLPAGTIPNVKKVRAEDLEEKYVDEQWGEDRISKMIQESIKGTEGLPIGITVQTRTNTEE
jgi:hypothetical protein